MFVLHVHNLKEARIEQDVGRYIQSNADRVFPNVFNLLSQAHGSIPEQYFL